MSPSERAKKGILVPAQPKRVSPDAVIGTSRRFGAALQNDGRSSGMSLSGRALDLGIRIDPAVGRQMNVRGRSFAELAFQNQTAAMQF